MGHRVFGGESPHVDRDRDYLTPSEANALIEAAGRAGRRRLRDQVLLRLIYRHGLRAIEAVRLKWTQFDFEAAKGKTLHVYRVKGSNDSLHTLDRDEVWRNCHTGRPGQHTPGVIFSSNKMRHGIAALPFRNEHVTCGYAGADGMQARPHLLIVEDDPSVAGTIGDILGDLYRTSFAGNIAEARLRLGSDGIDLVLLDANLPDGSGLSLLAETAQAGLPVILMTGDTALLHEAGSLSCLVLPKPFRTATLLGHVMRVTCGQPVMALRSG